MKKILSFVLAMLLVIGLLPVMAFAEDHTHSFTNGLCECGACDHTHPSGTWTAWGEGKDEAATLPQTAGSYYLTADVTLDSTWTVPTTGTVKLCLNDHVIKIKLTKDKAESAIKVPENATLELYDCGTTPRYYTTYTKSTTVGTISCWKLNDDKSNPTDYTTTGGVITCANVDVSPSVTKGGGVYVTGGNFKMYGGNIAGNKVGSGGGVCVDKGSFTMYGGTICGGYSGSRGSGVAVTGEAGEASFTMNGGTICGNKGSEGAVHCGANASFTMNGGEISDNGLSGEGGVYVNEYGNFTMNNGTIRNNKAENGGGVYVESRGSFTMNNGTICNNKAQNGGGVYVCQYGDFTMNNGTICNNTVEKSDYLGGAGGGVYVIGTFTMNNGTISGNTAEDNGGGVINSSGTFTMNNGTISGNTAEGNGGGVSNSWSFTMNNGTISGNTAVYGGGVYNEGVLKLGNMAKITGNVSGGTITDGVLSGGTTNNVYLPNGKYITLDTTTKPTGSFKVGVTTETAPTADAPVKITLNGTVDDLKYFFSDNPAYYVNFVDSDPDYLELKLPEKHAINVIPSENGTVTASPNEAGKGDEITLTVVPDEGYQLKTLTVTDKDGETVTVTENKFQMPDKAVTITATFEEESEEPEKPVRRHKNTTTVTIGDSDDKEETTEENPDTGASVINLGAVAVVFGAAYVLSKKH